MIQIQIDDVPRRIDVDDDYIYIEIDDASASQNPIIGWLMVITGGLLNEDRDIPVRIGDKDTIPLTGQQIVNGKLDEMLQERR